MRDFTSQERRALDDWLTTDPRDTLEDEEVEVMGSGRFGSGNDPVFRPLVLPIDKASTVQWSESRTARYEAHVKNVQALRELSTKARIAAAEFEECARRVSGHDHQPNEIKEAVISDVVRYARARADSYRGDADIKEAAADQLEVEWRRENP